jgi:hypothetical protein
MTKKLLLGRFAVAIAALTILATTANAGPLHPAKIADYEKVDFNGSGCSTCTVSYTGGIFSALGNIAQVVALPSDRSLNVSDGTINILTGACDVKNCSVPNKAGMLEVGFANSGSNGISIMGLLPGMGSTPQLLMSGVLEDTVMVLRGPNATMAGCSNAKHAQGICGPDTGGLNAEISTTHINLIPNRV